MFQLEFKPGLLVWQTDYLPTKPSRPASLFFTLNGSLNFSHLIMTGQNNAIIFKNQYTCVGKKFTIFHLLFLIYTYILSLASQSNVKPWHNLVQRSLSKNKLQGIQYGLHGNSSVVSELLLHSTADNIASIFKTKSCIHQVHRLTDLKKSLR